MTSRGLVPAPLLSSALAIALLGGGMALAFIVCRETRFVPLVLAATLLVPLVSFARANLTNLALSFIVADHLCQFLKRAIFVLGPQQLIAYYGFQALSISILGIAVVSALFVIRKNKWPPSIKLLVLWLLIGGFDSALNPASINLLASIGGVAVVVMPVLAVFLGMALPSSSWRSIARLFTVLIVISVTYGLFQYFAGYTAIDRAWAFATHGYSVQGTKVYEVLIGLSDEVRAYSYYADHLTWGYFLAIALLFVTAVVSAKLAPRRWLYVSVLPAVAGCVICQTRTVWVALLGAIVIHRIISLRGFRRPLLVMGAVFVSFGMVLWLGAYAISHNVYLGYVSSRLLKRYSTVGTISARISAPEIFEEALPTHLLTGEGFGSSGYFRGLDQSLGAFRKDQFSHNVIVDVLLQSGLSGLLVTILFLYSWLREAFWCVRASSQLTAKALRWMIAIVVGMVLTGGLNGLSFETAYFFLLIGIVSGEWSRLQAARREIAIDFALPVRRRPDQLALRA